MTEQKQIEEMAKLACTVFDGDCTNCPCRLYSPCAPKASADALYTAGYRKQSVGEWEMQKFPLTQCSVCGVVRNCETEMGWNYCPNCGAMMKGDEGK